MKNVVLNDVKYKSETKLKLVYMDYHFAISKLAFMAIENSIQQFECHAEQI